MKFFNQMIITGMLTKIAVTDWKEQKIFNQDVTILFCYCLMQLFFCLDQGEWGRLLFYVISGVCSASGVLVLITILSSGAFGGGDIKLMAAVGSLLGPVKSLYSLTAAIILCGIYILAGMANGKIKRNSVVAFGPFLCAGILYHLWSMPI